MIRAAFFNAPGYTAPVFADVVELIVLESRCERDVGDSAARRS